MRKRVTIKDVAREAGVSIKTVSNVINDSGSMRPETRKRVKAVMDAMGYQLNVSARSLKTGHTKVIGIAVEEFKPFFLHLINAISDAAHAHGYGVIVNTHGGRLRQFQQEANILAADGWILHLSPHARDGFIHSSWNRPTVQVGEYSTAVHFDTVAMSNRAAMDQMTGRFLDSGCRRVGAFGAPESLIPAIHAARNGEMTAKALLDMVFAAVDGAADLRLQGFCDAFVKRGMMPDWDLICCDDAWSTSRAFDMTGAMLDRTASPDAMVCFTDEIAIGVLHACMSRGLRVPGDVQISGHDDIDESRFVNPALTTIDPTLREYANVAFDMLLERIQGYDGPPRFHMTGYTLVERDSTRLTGPAAVRSGE
ncbi:LacI family transcriptional regulator [Bifidobacterium margollesii]|uniref:LacI family transcriptional regulator n=1 Tax=Bifidobacterium margollesii TaxID=2020964 RepID=A0A2N5JB25_9BIFI|nr:LacI family DNA-binding transcriptional regulator [Bifidobacterium margollesii]PLS31417.1 LacI family transcriptional regulator [Bifidobacterium margollesii]